MWKKRTGPWVWVCEKESMDTGGRWDRQPGRQGPLEALTSGRIRRTSGHSQRIQGRAMIWTEVPGFNSPLSSSKSYGGLCEREKSHRSNHWGPGGQASSGGRRQMRYSEDEAGPLELHAGGWRTHEQQRQLSGKRGYRDAHGRYRRACGRCWRRNPGFWFGLVRFAAPTEAASHKSLTVWAA